MNAHESFSQTSDHVPEEPTPIMRDLPAPEPYPVDAMGSLRPAAQAIHDMTQAPVAIGAQSVLGVAALCVQGLADVETLHGSTPASLFLLTVAQSGERKSACDKLAMAAVREFETELGEISREDGVRHLNALDIWSQRRKEIINTAKKDPDGASADLDALGPEPEPPLFATIVSGDPTLEGLVKHMGRLRPALGLFSDEGGSFVGGHAMNSDNKLKTVAGLSKLWDGAPIDRWRGGDGVALFPGRRLSAHLMAQPVAAAGLLADPIANGQGFLARFLLTEPCSAIGTRLRVGHDRASEIALEAFKTRAAALLRAELPMKDGARNELRPPLLALSDPARSVLQAFALQVEKEQAKGGQLETVRPFASKAAEHAARIAAVLTLFADERAAAVSGETMAQATTLAAYYVNEAARLTDAATISEEAAAAEKLRKWLIEVWPERMISVTDATQFGPGDLREARRIRKLFKILIEHGWLLPIDGGADIRGKRRREAWRIVGGSF
ncbi:MAG: YfjI family protein [Pseudomonadota bacterium]